MSIEPRMVTVGVLVHTALQIDEPDWCAGHPGGRAAYKADLAHTGPEDVIAPGGREVCRAFLTQTPFAVTDRAVGLHVGFADLSGTRTPAEVEQLADDLDTAAARLRELARGLAVILAGGENR